MKYSIVTALHDDDNDDDDDDPRQGPVHWLAPHPAGGLLAAGREDGVVAVMKVGEGEMSPDQVLILVCTMQVSDSLASTTKEEKVG